MIWALAFSVSLVAVWSLCFPLIRELKRRQVMDRPNERSSHSSPTPRGGGLAIVLVLFAGMLVIGVVRNEGLPLLLAGCVFVLGTISFLDDLRPIAPGTRFAVQGIAAILFMVGIAGGKGLAGSVLGSAIGQWGMVLVLCIYLVGYSNSFNFMDGINGLAAVQSAVTGAGVGALAFWAGPVSFETIGVCSFLLAGTSLGFLPHNFPRARVFMGDVGSVPLGFVSAALGVALADNAGLWLLVPVVMLQANFILDTSITLARRMLRGEQIFKPHRDHFYQRLVRAGYSHLAVTVMETCLQCVTLALALHYVRFQSEAPFVIPGFVLLYWCGFFIFAEASFRRAQKYQNDGSQGEFLENSPMKER